MQIEAEPEAEAEAESFGRVVGKRLMGGGLFGGKGASQQGYPLASLQRQVLQGTLTTPNQQGNKATRVLPQNHKINHPTGGFLSFGEPPKLVHSNSLPTDFAPADCTFRRPRDRSVQHSRSPRRLSRRRRRRRDRRVEVTKASEPQSKPGQVKVSKGRSQQ